MPNIIEIRRSLRAFLQERLGADFNGKPLKPFNFLNTGAQGGIVFGEMEFIANQNKGRREVSIGQMFPVYTRSSGGVPDLEEAYEISLGLADKIAVIVNEWVQNCSSVAIMGANSFTASGQVLPIEMIRGAIKGTDIAASTEPTSLPMPVQPLTASYYAIAVVKFSMLYLASAD
jgi:hypothetical protein